VNIPLPSCDRTNVTAGQPGCAVPRCQLAAGGGAAPQTRFGVLPWCGCRCGLQGVHADTRAIEDAFDVGDFGQPFDDVVAMDDAVRDDGAAAYDLYPPGTVGGAGREAGVFTMAHEAFWAAAVKVHGEAAGSRALIDVLLLHHRPRT
jgi:hypothetical protein